MDRIGHVETSIERHPQVLFPVNAAEVADDVSVDDDLSGREDCQIPRRWSSGRWPDAGRG
jgi:hypothetical protein